jgi:prolyl-tRNA synthetase
MKGIPLRIEIGPKDVAKDQVVLARRDTGEKDFVKVGDLNKKIPKIIGNIHNNLFKKAETMLKKSLVTAKNWGDVVKGIRDKKLVKMLFCGEPECEDYIKEKTGGASSRCITEDKLDEEAKCLHCNKKAKYAVLFGKSY